jgi:hypothetical protein
MQELETRLSEKQLDVIKRSYAKNPANFEGSDTYRAMMLDLELQLRKTRSE